jgi:hypothetical protein
VNGGAEEHDLLVPGLDQVARVFEARFRVGEVLEQTVLLLDDALVVGERLDVAVVQRDNAPV